MLCGIGCSLDHVQRVDFFHVIDTLADNFLLCTYATFIVGPKGLPSA